MCILCGLVVRLTIFLGAFTIRKASLKFSVLPPRSMVGQLTLDQHIGVRIPGGQPITDFLILLRTIPN
jgi:hypothetical protein